MCSFLLKIKHNLYLCLQTSHALKISDILGADISFRLLYSSSFSKRTIGLGVHKIVSIQQYLFGRGLNSILSTK